MVFIVVMLKERYALDYTIITQTTRIPDPVATPTISHVSLSLNRDYNITYFEKIFHIIPDKHFQSLSFRPQGLKPSTQII